MDPITLNLRVGRTPAASSPVGGELSAAEIDANFTNLKNAAEQLDEEKVAVSALTPVTDFATPTAGDSIVIQRGAVLYRALVDTLIGGGSSASPLGLWDHWTDWRAASGNANAPGLFAGAAVSSGTNTTALPTGGMAGYNDHGVFLRSSTTANGGYRYQTTSLVGMYFGGVARKYRCQFLWRTSFTGVTVRTGYHDTNTSADAVDGAYFEIVGSTCSAKTANNSTRTTHATTITMSLDVAYTFDIEVNAAATEARFRVWGGNDYDTALMDVTITTNIPSTNARTFGAGIVATESSTTASDIGILYSLGMGTPAGFARLYGVYTPAATAPAAFTAGQWTAAATSTPGEISFDLTALPSDGGSAITSLEYRVNTGAAIAFTGTGTGVRVVTAGLTAGVAVDLQVRAVNAVGAGAWSDIKNRTPAASGGGGGTITVSQNTGAGLDLGESATFRNGGGTNAGYWEPGNGSARMLWRPGTGFNTTNIPGTITAATLRLYMSEQFGASTVTAYNNLRAWAVWAGGPSWTEWGDGSAWAAAGGSGAADRSASAIGTQSAPATNGVWVEIALDAATVEAWRQAGGAGACGVQLAGNDQFSTFITDVGTDGQRPELVVTYS